MRAFLAVEISDEAREELIRIQKEFAPLIKAKFVEPENLHLTLKFFGEIDEEDVKEIVKGLRKVRFGKFPIKLGNVGFYPNLNHARVFCIKLESDKINELYKLVEKSVEIKDDGFDCHVTLARIKEIKNKHEFTEKVKDFKIKPISFEAKEFILEKSTLTEKGPIYEDVEKFELT